MYIYMSYVFQRLAFQVGIKGAAWRPGVFAVVNQLRLKNLVTGYLNGYHVPFPWDLNCNCKVELQPMEHWDGLTIWLWNLAILNTFWWQ